MSNDYIAPIVARLTYNGAANLVGTLERRNERCPDAINGGCRLYTGLGKWTHIAAAGVENHLIALGLATTWEERRGYGDRHEWLVITPLGREVAVYVQANWDALEFRDGRRP